MTQQTADPIDSDVADSRVRIFDTTLRDGEQAPGFSMNRAAKLRLAHALEDLGVDILEAGFPHASPDDFAAVADIAARLRTTTVCGLARCHVNDIDSAGRALENAARSRIHVFLSTSPLHREHKLNMSRAQVLDTAVMAVERAMSLCHEVEFSAEDALRTEPEYLAEVFSAVIAAGANTVNAPDTVGYTTPAEMAELFAYLRRTVIGAERVVFSAHCHDDLGMAVANSMAAIGAGARQVECTINGIGERAGNASLEEIVMALKVRAPLYNTDTRIDTTKLFPTSRLLSQLTGQAVPRNKAIVGDNAFAHESGIHQHGMLKHRGTYEIMRPQDVGIGLTRLVLGKHSGRAALRQRLETLGHRPDDTAMDAIFARFKALADVNRDINDDDLDAIAQGRDPQALGPWHLVQLNTSNPIGGAASVAIRLVHADGREIAETASGAGTVDALLHAMAQATGKSLDVAHFQLQSDRRDDGSQGHAQLTVHYAGREWRGHGRSSDGTEATAQAALAVVNRIERQQLANAPTAVAPL